MDMEHKGTILIVDDDSANLGVLFESLRQANFKVLIAEDGTSALKRFDYSHPDVILLDVQMPDMDGFEVYRRLKVTHDVTDTLVIFLSVVAEPVEKVRAFGMNAVDYVTKPFDSTEVVARIEKHLMLRNLRKSLQEKNIQLEQEIAERTRVEAQLNAALQEKEVLLKEVFHRVKNNLTALISLINLQVRAIEDPAVVQMFGELKGRVEVMTLIHQRLYQSGNMASINFGNYLRELVGDLVYAHRVGRRISWQVEAEDVFITVNNAIPCGLIANELVTNVLKYAFPAGEAAIDAPRKLCVAFKQDAGEYVLTVSDNGVGLPPDLDWQNAKTLGLHLVGVLATNQLRGRLELVNQAGATFTVSFPV